MEKVIWKDIEGYEGYYQVSSNGLVRSLDRIVPYRNSYKKIKGRILGQSTDRDGYKHLRLRKGGGEKSFFVHRLVAQAFVENQNLIDYDIVNHKDENKANNHYTNLEWCDVRYNNNYGSRKQRLSKPIIAYNDKEMFYFNSLTEASHYGFNVSSISKVLRNKMKKHKGYRWEIA